MRRLLGALTATCFALLLAAPVALANDHGEGTWGETDDKVITFAGFILIIFFALFVTLVSVLQSRLERRKQRLKEERKKLAGLGGW